MHRFVFPIVAAIILLPSAVHANLLSNSGFETGDLSSWNAWSSSQMIYDWGHNGSAHSVAAWPFGGAWQDVNISNPNAPTLVGGWIYEDSADPLTGDAGANLRVEFKNASNMIVGQWTTNPLEGADLINDTWNSFSAIVTPAMSYGPGITKATFVWEVGYGYSGGGRAIFDDLVIEPNPIPEPTSMLMLGFGLFSIGLFRKKETGLKKKEVK